MLSQLRSIKLKIQYMKTLTHDIKQFLYYKLDKLVEYNLQHKSLRFWNGGKTRSQKHKYNV